MSTTTASTSIILTPRPYSQFSGRLLLLPLLPAKEVTLPDLPTELWTSVFQHAATDSTLGQRTIRSLQYVSKRFNVCDSLTT